MYVLYSASNSIIQNVSENSGTANLGSRVTGWPVAQSVFFLRALTLRVFFLRFT